MAQEIAVKFSALHSAPQGCQAGYFALAEAKKKWQRMMLIRNFIELILIHLAGDGSGWRLGEITCGPQLLASGPRLAAASNNTGVDLVDTLSHQLADASQRARRCCGVSPEEAPLTHYSGLFLVADGSRPSNVVMPDVEETRRPSDDASLPPLSKLCVSGNRVA